MNNDKFVFMHLPKCAGTTLRIYLEDHFGRDQIHAIYMQDDFPADWRQVHQNFVIGHFGYRTVEPLLAERKAFTFMRDPVDRLLSHYYFWLHLDEATLGPRLAKRMSLSEFLRCDVPQIKMQVHNLQAWSFISGIEIYERIKLSHLSEDDLFELAVAHVHRFDFIGFTESFAQDFNRMIARYGWQHPYDNTVKNKTKQRKKQHELSQEEQELLLQATALDRRLYDYIKTHIYPQQ